MCEKKVLLIRVVYMLRLHEYLMSFTNIIQQIPARNVGDKICCIIEMNQADFNLFNTLFNEMEFTLHRNEH